jgi:hypothetical protein
MADQTSFPFMKGKKYSATIARASDGTIRIRVMPGDPHVAADEKLIEILYGDDEEELKERAVRFAKENA